MAITLILDNIRSAYNVGAIFRSADVFGVEKIILTGVSPYPRLKNDLRLPHIRDKAAQMIAKTALGAEKTVLFEYIESLTEAIDYLQIKHVPVVALEQHPKSIPIRSFKVPKKFAILLGNEVAGISESIVSRCDAIIEISQYGIKESLNVSVAAGIALFELTKQLDK